MRKPFSLAAVIRLLAALTVVVSSAVLLSSTDEPAFTQNDKAFYADSNLVNFVRPGLVVKIQSADLATDGTISVRFTLTDPKGLALDREGVTTPGAISTSFVAAYIPKGQTQYISYATRTSTGSNGNGVTVIQAAADSGGKYVKNADGDYTYTFKTKAAAADRTATHTIGMYANRNLTEFDLDGNANRADTVYHWVPAGGTPVTRDVIRTATCNKCHDPLSAHGTGGRKSMEVCVLCHNPTQAMNPATGVTGDLPVMIHKIHMGKELPSVKAGKPYQWITSHGTSDFSTVGFPAGVNNCVSCHDQNSPAAQKTNLFKPTRAACGACHDNVNFATGENHANLPQISDNQCQTCHQPQGEMDFDISVLGAHVTPTQSRALPGTVLDVMAVDNVGPGKAPIVTFLLKDKAGNPIEPSKMNALRLVVAGPTTDYMSYKSIDVRKATGAGDGRFYWTLDTLPADAKGSISVGIEGYRNVTLYAGTKVEQTVRDAGINKVKTFSVTGAAAEARKQVVSIEKCNSCHSFLSPHGGNRNQIEQCVLCHNPTETDKVYRKATDGPANTMDLKHLIHKLHTGEAMDGNYVIVGYQGSKTDFKEVLYPGDRRNCSACHVNGSENLPVPAGRQEIKSDEAGWLNPMGPETSACTGCHTSVAAASHALSNTTRLGEACSACHGGNSEFSVSKVHAR